MAEKVHHAGPEAYVSLGHDASRIDARTRSEIDRSTAVERVIGAMHERIDRPLTLEQMARIAYLSPFYFNRVFRQVTGVPPRRFQTALRMVAAKRLLLTTDLSVTEICLEVGYRSLGTFTTQFRELVGLSPRSLRGLGERPWPVAALDPQVVRPAGPGGVLTGVISAPDDTPRFVFVGVFADPSPQGIPRACSVLSNAGSYRIAPVQPGRHHVAAAALPHSSDPRRFLMPDDDAVLVAAADRVANVRGRVTEVRNLQLRPKRTTDPPILLAPHALLGVR
jgi:AraC-like DNA-binding protein